MEEADGYSVLSYVPIASLPYGQPKSTYTLVSVEDNNNGKSTSCRALIRNIVFNWRLSINQNIFVISVSGTFLNTLKFIVKDCDPNTGEPDDDQGYDDEYVVCYIHVVYFWILQYTLVFLRGNTLCLFLFIVNKFNLYPRYNERRLELFCYLSG